MPLDGCRGVLAGPSPEPMGSAWQYIASSRIGRKEEEEEEEEEGEFDHGLKVVVVARLAGRRAQNS